MGSVCLFDCGSNYRRFSPVNDTVMGGCSQSSAEKVNGAMRFRGTVSFENNGGFASARTDVPVPPTNVDHVYTHVALRVRGDAKVYKFNIYTSHEGGRTGVYFQQKFETSPCAAGFQTLMLPCDAFRLTFRGRVVDQHAALAVEDIVGIGIMIGDRQEGPFQLDVQEISLLDIKTVSAEAPATTSLCAGTNADDSTPSA